MTPTEVLLEIQKLPLSEVREVASGVTKLLQFHNVKDIPNDEVERREAEFERRMLEAGFITHIATNDITDEDFDSFDLIDVGGEPLSETISRERR